MITFLRQIRHRLILQKRLRRYLIYAIGEIVLVVIGILIALQINNWNETRRQGEEFKNVLEQLYNTIKSDIAIIKSENIINRQFINNINEIIYELDSLSDQRLEILLVNLDNPGAALTNEHDLYLSKLPINLKDEQQVKILKQVGNYLSGNIIKDFFSANDKSRLHSLFDKHHLPRPYDSFSFNILEDHYTDEDMVKIRALMKTPEAISALKNIRQELRRTTLVTPTLISDAETVTKMIRDYMPHVRLLYENVGIVGTAVNGAWENSVPMTLVDDVNSIWEIEWQLQDGELKFRTRNSWVQNWGGTEFPEGKAEFYGPNIKVEEGFYNIRINLLDETYEFIKLK